MKFWPELQTRTLAEILKIDECGSLSSFTAKLWRSVKMIKFECKHDLQVFSWWMEPNEEVLVIFKFWPKSHTRTLGEILEFFFIHCKTVKVSQDDQIRMETWFTSVFLINGTELRSFNRYEILTWIADSDLSRNLENWWMWKFVFIHWKTVKVSQDDQIWM